jgi:tetrahydromethanopterin S-methyltransferase subunit A
MEEWEMESIEVRTNPRPSWPVMEGAYLVGDRDAPVAVCALTTEELLAPLVTTPGAAIVGTLHTANLGIEHMITNIIANPAIRFLLLCGRESQVFHPGQSVVALIEQGVDAQGTIIGAQGYRPELRNLHPDQIEDFRRQIELADWTDERESEALRARITSLAARTPGRFTTSSERQPDTLGIAPERPRFKRLPIGGSREPLTYDPKGYFVITLDRAAGEILVRHYLPDNTPAHEMRGRSPEALTLGLLRAGLVSQLSHAAYLGAEFAKAQAALRLNLRYEQDRPLRGPQMTPSTGTGADTNAAPEARPAISAPMTWEELTAVAVGGEAQVAIKVTATPASGIFVGYLAEPAGDIAQREYRRTEQTLTVHWNADIRVAMGTAADIQVDALLRARGALLKERELQAVSIAVITHVATLV